MECNKDEAVRSKGIAEAKFLQHDFIGARKFAQKARQLFPELEGLPQFVAVLDVHIVAQEKLQGGETNWYGILQVDSNADESTIRKQYRKLALLLHPDKNKSLGAEAAFKYISEAWGVLSDKVKKALYDGRCSAKASQSSKQAQFKEGANGGHNVTRTYTTNQPQPHSQSQPQPQAQPQRQPPSQPPLPRQRQSQPPPMPSYRGPVPPPINLMTFWTACPSCKMQFEYQRIYINKNLCCPICYKPFISREVAPLNGTVLWPPQERATDASANGSANGFNFSSFLNSNFYPPPQGNMNVKPAQTNEKVKKVEKVKKNDKAKKEMTEAQAQKLAEQQQKKKEREEIKAKAAAHAKEVFNRLIAKSKGVIEQKLSAEKESKVAADKPVPGKSPASNTGNASGKENRGLQESEDGQKPEASGSPLASRKSPRGKRNASADPEVQDDLFAKKPKSVSGLDELFVSPKHSVKRDSIGQLPVGVSSSPVSPEPQNLSLHSDAAINVPDSEFYDFDSDRTENHFAAGQIWAAYDEEDGMPRYYARISKVISRQPFKIQMAWLEARSPSEETLVFLDNGFSYTCGEFKLGKSITSEQLNTFSHLVTFEKGQRGYKIYPVKGDIWALYKDLDPLSAKNGKHAYEIIEVLTSFSDEEGVQVSKLAKVDGYKTLFKRQAREREVKRITPKEMWKFSHQVPAHRLSAEQVPGEQECCWELDPASLQGFD